MNTEVLIQVANVVLKVAAAGPEIFDSLKKALPVAEDLYKKLTSGTPPTVQEWADLHTMIESLSEELDQPEENE